MASVSGMRCSDAVERISEILGDKYDTFSIKKALYAAGGNEEIAIAALLERNEKIEYEEHRIPIVIMDDGDREPSASNIQTKQSKQNRNETLKSKKPTVSLASRSALDKDIEPPRDRKRKPGSPEVVANKMPTLTEEEAPTPSTSLGSNKRVKAPVTQELKQEMDVDEEEVVAYISSDSDYEPRFREKQTSKDAPKRKENQKVKPAISEGEVAPLDVDEFFAESSWPKFLGSLRVSCYSVTNSLSYTVKDPVSFSIQEQTQPKPKPKTKPKPGKKRLSSSEPESASMATTNLSSLLSRNEIVRVSIRGREVGRMPSDLAQLIGPLVRMGFISVECAHVSKNPDREYRLKLSSDISVMVKIHLHRSAFADEEFHPNIAASALQTIHEMQDEQTVIPTLRDFIIQLVERIQLEECSNDDEAEVIVLDPELRRESKKAQSEDESESQSDRPLEDESSDMPASIDQRVERGARLLKSELRSYQRHGVSWMISRELHGMESNDVNGGSLWQLFKFPGTDRFLYMNKSARQLSLRPPMESQKKRGGILADEMGLGKTVQILATVLCNLNETNLGHGSDECPLKFSKASGFEGGTLVICTTSLLNQWAEEITKHVKEGAVRVKVFYGADRDRDGVNSYSLRNADIVLTTYGTLVSELSNLESKASLSILYRICWQRVVLDEAHYIKGRSSKTSKAAIALDAHVRWVVSGTIVQNSHDDLFSLLRFLRLHPWCDYRYWNANLLKLVQSPNDEDQVRGHHLIRKVVKPIMLRRTALDVGKEDEDKLPGKVVQIVRLTPSPDEKDVYDALFERSYIKFEGFLKKGTLFSNYTTVLQLLMKLRQCCNHPFLLRTAPSKDTKYISDREKFEAQLLKAHQILSRKQRERNLNVSEPDEVQEGVDSEGAASEGAHTPSRDAKYIRNAILSLENMDETMCPICIDSLDDAVISVGCGHVACRNCLEGLFGNRDRGPCPICRSVIQRDDLVTVPRASRFAVDFSTEWRSSSKIDYLLECLDEIHESNKETGVRDKVVVFSQWTAMLDLLEVALKREDHTFGRLDGSCSQAARTAVLADFASQSRSSPFVLLVSLKAGGVGLNLTSANHCFLMDPYWNSAVEAQAIGRVYRIGQTKSVHVKRLVIGGSIEERLLEIQQKKTQIVDAVERDDFALMNRAQEKEARLEDIKYLFRK